MQELAALALRHKAFATIAHRLHFYAKQSLAGTLFNARIESNTSEVYTGLFAFTSFESSGEYNKGELFAITLESAGTTAFVDNDFRLLETGGIRLLEDGSYRILEAA